MMVSDEALKKLQEQIAAWPMTQRFVVQQLIEDYRRNREDLRAYKATGLTPEEVSTLVKDWNDLRTIVGECGGITRVKELAEADKDGRVVVYARWIPFHSETAGDIQYCSNCKIGNAAKSDFCPHCGAKMDERAANRTMEQEADND